MSESQQAERDWAAYYLLQRSAPLRSTALKPQHFGTPQIAQWHEAALRLGDWVRFDEIGISVDECQSLTATPIDSRMVPEIERRVVQGWAVRRISWACDEFLRESRGGLPDGLENAAQRLREAVTEAESGMPVDSVSHFDAGKAAVEDWVKDATAPEPRSIPLPWGVLQRHVHGIPRKKLILIGGRSSEHKTTTARSIAAHAAAKGFRTLYWTLEDCTTDIAGRTITDAVGYVTTTAMATGGWPSGSRRPDAGVLQTFFHDLEDHLRGNVGKHLRYIDRSHPTRSQVIATIRAEAARGLDLFVGDFLQLVTPDNARERISDTWWRGTMSMLSGLAQELDIGMIWTSQLEKTGSKESKNDNRVPMAIEMPYGAQLWQGAYGILMVGLVGNERLRVNVDKWKSAAQANGQSYGILLDVIAKHDRLVERG